MQTNDGIYFRVRARMRKTIDNTDRNEWIRFAYTLCRLSYKYRLNSHMHWQIDSEMHYHWYGIYIRSLTVSTPHSTKKTICVCVCARSILIAICQCRTLCVHITIRIPKNCFEKFHVPLFFSLSQSLGVCVCSPSLEPFDALCHRFLQFNSKIDLIHSRILDARPLKWSWLFYE